VNRKFIDESPLRVFAAHFAFFAVISLALALTIDEAETAKSVKDSQRNAKESKVEPCLR
jgi:hypothetical protein